MTFGGSFERRDVLLVVDHPGHLRRVEAVFVDEDAAGPHAGGHRIGADPDLLAFEVLRAPDVGVRPHHEAAVMEAPHQEDRQRRIGRAAGARDHVGRRRHFADVELEVADHAPERGDDRNHLDEIGVDALDRHLARFEGARMPIIRDRDFQAWLASHVLLRHIFQRSANALRRGLCRRAATGRSMLGDTCLVDDLAPLGDVPRHPVVHLLRRAPAGIESELAACDPGPPGSASARLISVLSMVMIGAGTPAGAATPFQLDHHVVRQSAFRRGRHVLEHGIALVAGRGDDAQLVRARSCSRTRHNSRSRDRPRRAAARSRDRAWCGR